MIKRVNFQDYHGPYWPEPSKLEPYFLAAGGEKWLSSGGNDSWGLDIQGLYGTAHLPERDRVNVHLYMTGHPDHGVQLKYNRWDGRVRKLSIYASKGDMRRVTEHVHSMHGTLLPIGLFVPFPVAWRAVKEFMERDGELPASIEWVDSDDLPPEAFPDPPRPSSIKRR